MASLLQKLLRKSVSPLQTLTFLSKSQPRTSLLRPPNLLLKPDLLRNPCPDPMAYFPDNNAVETTLIWFYPSFSHLFNLDPFSLARNVQSDTEPDHVSESDGRTVWADSVKKKRKRKMNRHKYRKLKKRLRRQA